MLRLLIALFLFLYCAAAKSIQFHKLLQQESKDNFYFLKTKVGNIEMDLKLSLLPEDKNWVKSKGCVVCDQDDKNDCGQSCFRSQEQFGIRCVKPHCTSIEESYKSPIILQGTSAYINFNLRQKKQELNRVPMILAEKMTELRPYAGIINPIQSDMRISKKVILQWKNSTIQLTHGEQFKETYIGQPIKFQFLDIESGSKQQISLNEFEVGQIKLMRKDALGTVEEDDEQSFGGIKNLTAHFSTDSQNLLLPSKLYHKIMGHIVNQWISPHQNHRCIYSGQKISCQDKLSLELIRAAKITIVLNGIDLSFPLEMLIHGVKQKSCETLLKQSKSKNEVFLGDFILKPFSLEYDMENGTLKLYRLDNNWAKYFDANRKRSENGMEYGYFWGFLVFFLTIFWYLIKFILLLALFSLLINCYCRRDQLIRWFFKIAEKLSKRRQRAFLKQVKQQQEGFNQITEDDIQPQ